MTRPAALAAARDRTPTEPLDVVPAPVRVPLAAGVPTPRLPMPALAPAARGGWPDPLTPGEERVAELIDRHLDGRPPLPDLAAALAAQTWPTLPAAIHAPPERVGALAAAYRAALTRELQAAIAPLHELVAPFRAAAARPCPNCRERDLCPFHRRALRDWWDHLHPVARDVVHALPARAEHALRSFR